MNTGLFDLRSKTCSSITDSIQGAVIYDILIDLFRRNPYSYFEGIVNQIYPPELQLNKVDESNSEAPCLDLHLSISHGFVSSKIYDKRDDFDFDIVIFPFWTVTLHVVALMECIFLNL